MALHLQFLILAAEQRIDLAVSAHITEDQDDNRILECALEAGSAYIVTGDKDLHRLGQFRDARVNKVADILDVVQGTGWRSR